MELGPPSTGTTGARRGRSRLQPGPEDLAAHERARGRIPPGACVALRSGWDAHVATPRFRNADASGALRFPASPRRGAAAARARRRRRGGGHAGRWTSATSPCIWLGSAQAAGGSSAPPTWARCRRPGRPSSWGAADRGRHRRAGRRAGRRVGAPVTRARRPRQRPPVPAEDQPLQQRRRLRPARR